MDVGWFPDVVLQVMYMTPRMCRLLDVLVEEEHVTPNTIRLLVGCRMVCGWCVSETVADTKYLSVGLLLLLLSGSVHDRNNVMAFG